MVGFAYVARTLERCRSPDRNARANHGKQRDDVRRKFRLQGSDATLEMKHTVSHTRSLASRKSRPTRGDDLLQDRRLLREGLSPWFACPSARRIGLLSMILLAYTSSDCLLLFLSATAICSNRLRATAGLPIEGKELDESLEREHAVQGVRRKTASRSEGIGYGRSFFATMRSAIPIAPDATACGRVIRYHSIGSAVLDVGILRFESASVPGRCIPPSYVRFLNPSIESKRLELRIHASIHPPCAVSWSMEHGSYRLAMGEPSKPTLTCIGVSTHPSLAPLSRRNREQEGSLPARSDRISSHDVVQGDVEKSGRSARSTSRRRRLSRTGSLRR